MNQTRIPIKSLTVHDTLNRINREGLTGEYAGMVSDYVRTGILDGWGSKNGTSTAYRLCISAQPGLVQPVMSSRFSYLALWLLQTRVTTLRLTLQL